MLAYLEALTPPLVVAAALVIGVVMFLRRQMGAPSATDGHDQAEIQDDDANDGQPDHPHAPPAGRGKG